MSYADKNKNFTAKNLFNVEDWVCVVTGGGTGLGLSIAQSFANNGARVYITGRRQGVLESACCTWGGALASPKGNIFPITADIADKASIQKLVDEISTREKKVDVLVNNAGIAARREDNLVNLYGLEELHRVFQKETREDWEEVYRTNVIGHFLTTIAFLPLLSAANSPGHTASVINVSSVSGISLSAIAGYCTISHHRLSYCVSKAADIGLTEFLSQEIAVSKVNIRVNSIAPGLFPSELTAGPSDEANKSTLPYNDTYGEDTNTPAGRPGREEDIAQTALFVACNEYMYGQTIVIDGGNLMRKP